MGGWWRGGFPFSTPLCVPRCKVLRRVVLDVIVNEEHRDYGSSGFNVGTIRFKYLDYGAHRDSIKTGFRAYPLEVDVQSYPLIGEIVFIQKIIPNFLSSDYYPVAWSLSIEEFFYLFFPLILIFLGKNNLIKKVMHWLSSILHIFRIKPSIKFK